MDFFSASLEIKAVNTAQRIISGYAAIHHNIDRVRDIIDPTASVKAVRRIRDPKMDIPVFIGHKHDELSMGHPLLIQATPRGLYTETYIYQGSDGDNLLAKAQDMQAHGVPLGMSIGYKTHDSRQEHTARGRVRRLLDYELKEYSYAAHQTTANPEATMTDIKTLRNRVRRDADHLARQRKALAEGTDTAGGALVPPDEKEGGMQYRVEHVGDRWTVYCDTDNDGDGDDNRVVGTYTSQEMAEAVVAALRGEHGTGEGEGDGEPEERGEEMTASGKTLAEQTAVRSMASMENLPDSSFLYIESGGQRDGEQKTVPRAKRHFPVKDASGKVDLPLLRKAIARIPQSSAEGLNKEAVQARARAMLERANGGEGAKTAIDVEAPEWQTGAPLAVRALAYHLLDLSEQIATEQKAMALLGEDVKDYYRIRQPVRDELKTVQAELEKIVGWSATIDAGQDEAAQIEWFRAKLALATA